MEDLAALLFGIVAGLRTFTGEAVFYAMRGSGTLQIVFPLLALGEYAADLHPKIPPRTMLGSVLIRCASGAFMGWLVAHAPGAAFGAIGAIAGTFGGYRLRLWLIAVIRPVPAGIAEDVIAVVLAFLALATLR